MRTGQITFVAVEKRVRTELVIEGVVSRDIGHPKLMYGSDLNAKVEHDYNEREEGRTRASVISFDTDDDASHPGTVSQHRSVDCSMFLCPNVALTRRLSSNCERRPTSPPLSLQATLTSVVLNCFAVLSEGPENLRTARQLSPPCIQLVAFLRNKLTVPLRGHSHSHDGRYRPSLGLNIQGLNRSELRRIV